MCTARAMNAGVTRHRDPSPCWWNALGGGDVTAWNAIVDRFAGLVWSVARRHRLSPSDAADVSQTTWLRLVEHIDRIQDPERVGGWLATTARHEALRVLRVSGRELPSEHDNFIDLLPDENEEAGRRGPARRGTRPRAVGPRLDASGALSAVAVGAPRRVATELRGDRAGTRDAHGEYRTDACARCLEHLRRLAESRGITNIEGVS